MFYLLMYYLRPRLCCDGNYVILHGARAYDIKYRAYVVAVLSLFCRCFPVCKVVAPINLITF